MSQKSRCIDLLRELEVVPKSTALAIQVKLKYTVVIQAHRKGKASLSYQTGYLPPDAFISY